MSNVPPILVWGLTVTICLGQMRTKGAPDPSPTTPNGCGEPAARHVPGIAEFNNGVPVLHRNGIPVSPAGVLASALKQAVADEVDAGDGRTLIYLSGLGVGDRPMSLEAELRSFTVGDDAIVITLAPIHCDVSGSDVGQWVFHFYDNPIVVRVNGVRDDTLQYLCDAVDAASDRPTLAIGMDVTLDGHGNTLLVAGRKCMCCDGPHAVDAACTTKLCDQSGTCRGAAGTCTWIDMGGPSCVALLPIALVATLSLVPARRNRRCGA